MDNNSYTKNDQIARARRIHRDPARLRALLRLQVPTSRAESEAQRYGKCANPRCGNVGTIDRPLDLHHIVPRSQSFALINEYTNHLYLCGDFFHHNHHKALHGEMTPGLADWRNIGIFGEWDADAPCEPGQRVDGAADRLLQLARTDRICLVLAKNNPQDAFDYAIRKGVFPPNVIILPEDITYITDYFLKSI